MMENNAVKTETAPKKGNGRNSEKRRERSKVAARCRRSKESEIFSELAEFLPLPESTRNSLDKASVMRLSLSDLKLRHMMERVFSDNGPCPMRNEGLDELEAEVVSMANNAMGGFLLVMSTDGDIMYASDSISTHLGLSQVEVMGLSIYDFSHPCDHGDIKEMLAVGKKDGKEHEETTTSRSSTFRMKCTITARGRNVHLRAASYKVIDFSGRMFSSGNEQDSEGQWFIGIGEPLFHPSDVDIPLNKQTFLTKHSPDLKCEFVDDSVMCFLGYQPDDLIGKSIFEFHHASDGPALAKAFKSLYTKGQSVTERYRFLAKHGGWVWVITQATLIQPGNGSKPNSIVCLNFVTSGIENENEIMSSVQEERSAFSPFKMVLPQVNSMPDLSIRLEESRQVKKACEKENIVPEIIPDTKPIMSTKNVIAPRTEDMDSGFLMPCDDTLIVSKDEPEDLTHLAPIAGDACVPLDMPIPLLDTLLKEMEQANVPFVFNDNCVEINFDDVPRLEMPMFSSPVETGVEQELSDICVGGKQFPRLPQVSCSSKAPSPLFLNSDPPMVSSPGSKSSLLSPFQLSPNPTRNYRSNSDACSSSISGSSYEFQSSPTNGGSGYEDSRSPPALVGLNLQDDAFQTALLMESHLDDPGPGTSCTDFLSGTGSSKMTDFQQQRSGSPAGGFSGAYVTLADGRKFPVLPTSNPNEFKWAGQDLLLNNANDSAAKRIPVPVVEAPRTNGVDSRSGLCDLMEVDPNPLVVAKQSAISIPANDSLDAVLQGGGGGPKAWNWNSSLGSGIDQVPVKFEMNSNLAYKDVPSGPPSAKHPRMSTVLMGGDCSSSQVEYPALGEMIRPQQVNQGDMTPSPTLPTSHRKIPIPNRSPLMPLAKMPERADNSSTTTGVLDLGIDLKSCLQKLLSSGKADKVNEILRLLRDTNSNSEEDRVKKSGDGKGIGDAGGHSIAEKQVQSGSQSDSSQKIRGKFPPLFNRPNNNGLLSTLGTSSVGANNRALPGLLELTRQDCEVNAPLNESSCLLSGADLLTALENDVPEDSLV